MELKQIYAELVKSVVIFVTLYLPAMMIESSYDFQQWSSYTQIIFAFLYTYILVLIFDYNENTRITINKKFVKFLKKGYIRVKFLAKKLKPWR